MGLPVRFFDPASSGGRTDCGKKGRDDPYWSYKWTDDPAPLFEMNEDWIPIEESTDGKRWNPLVLNGMPRDDTE